MTRPWMTEAEKAESLGREEITMNVEYRESHKEGRVTWHTLELDNAPMAVHNLVEAGMYQLKHQVEALFGAVARMDDIETRLMSLERAESVNATIEERLDCVETKQANDRQYMEDFFGKPPAESKTLGEIADDVGAQDAFVNRTIAEHLERTEQGDDLLATIGDLNVAFHNFGVKTKGRFYSSEQIQAARNAFWRSLDDSRDDES